MERVRKTKLIEAAYKRYHWSEEYDILDAYKNPSYRKRDAWEYCQELANHFNYYEPLKVIGHNSMTFSAGFIGNVNGDPSFIYITPAHDRFIPLAELV